MSQGTPDPNQRSRYSLNSDEMIALFVAFLTLGSVLFWGFTRSGFRLTGGDDFLATGGERLLGAAEQAETRLGIESAETEAGLGLLESDEITEAERERAAPAEADGPTLRSTTPTVESEAAPETGGRSFGNTTTVPRQAAQPAQAEPTEPEAAVPVTPTALEASQEAVSFRDVPEGYWAKPFIDALSARGLIAGFDDGTFKPDDPVTRAQLARVINQSFDLSSEESTIDFTDIASDYWAYDAIQDSVTGGFMNGFPDESFKPDISVPRVQTLTALVTGLETEDAGNVETDVERYTDAAKIPDWAVSKVAAATEAGLVVNYPEINQLAPNQPTTRAEVAAMVYQALVYQGRLDPTESEYLVQP
ncbi:MAG: S-layer homology domain-containing protein [Cyanobacteria bacterium J06648_16]